MSSESQGLLGRVRAVPVIGDRFASDGPRLTDRLGTAELLSLVALVAGWTSVLLLVENEPNLALLAMITGFGLDKADGWWARRTDTTSAFGRRLDAYVDAVVYLVTGALLYHTTIAPSNALSLAIGSVVMGFGGLRLVRHGDEGFGSDHRGRFYRGITVVHVNVLVVFTYFGDVLFGWPSVWIGTAAIAVWSPLMVSNYKSYKTRRSHLIMGAITVVIVATSIAIEWGPIGAA